MGMILDPTPEMGDFSVEVRRESFYLNSQSGHVIAYGGGSQLEFDLVDIPAIRAALDQVEAYLKDRA
jgi:hypothetical protein